jgi:hypothetical protein
MQNVIRPYRLLATAIAVTAGTLPVHAALVGPGDLAFTSFNADEDGWTIVSLVDIDAGTTIFFRDDEWSGTSFNTGEGIHTWNSGAATIAAGTVVRFSAVDQATRAVSVGTLTSTGDTGVNATAETIYAYLGANANTPTAFLAGVASEGTVNLTPAGLVAGTSAVVLTSSADFGGYIGPRSGLAAFNLYAGSVNNAANWSIDVGGDGSAVVPNTTSFSVVPLPAAGGLLLSGIVGLLGVARRRRQTAQDLPAAQA